MSAHGSARPGRGYDVPVVISSDSVNDGSIVEDLILDEVKSVCVDTSAPLPGGLPPDPGPSSPILGFAKLLAPSLTPSVRAENYKKIQEALLRLPKAPPTPPPSEVESKFCEREVLLLPRDLYDFAIKFFEDGTSDGEDVFVAVDSDTDNDYCSDEYAGDSSCRIPQPHPESLSVSSLNVFDKKFRTYFGTTTVDFVQFLMDFAIMIKTIIKTNDKHVIWTLVYQFLRAQGVATVESSLLSFLVAPFLKKRKTRIVAEALSDEVDKVGDMMEYVFDSAFADAIKNILICGAVLKFCNYKTAISIFHIFGERPRGTLFDIVRSAVKSLAIVIKALEDIAAGKDDLHTIMFAKDRWVMAQQAFATLNFQKDRLRFGAILPDDGLFDRYNWLVNATQTRNYLQGKLNKTSQSKPIYLSISNMLTNLDTWISDVNAAAGAVYRRTPFGVVIYGMPGVGKSGCIDATANLWCRLRGMTYNAEMVYHRSKDSDFFDNLCNQPIGHWSEVGSENPEMAKKQINKMASELTSVLDSQPMMANQAELDKKGKKWINFEMVIADTNNKSMNFTLSTMNASAYLRRFVFVTQTVKPSSSKDYAIGVDPAKAAAAVANGAHEMDHFYFDIEEVLVQSNDKYTFQYATYVDHEGNTQQAKRLDIYAYGQAMPYLMKRHIAKEDLMENLRKTGKMYDVFDYKSAADYANRDNHTTCATASTTSSSGASTLGGSSFQPSPPNFGGQEEKLPMIDERVTQEMAQCIPRRPGYVYERMKKTDNLWYQINKDRFNKLLGRAYAPKKDEDNYREFDDSGSFASNLGFEIDGEGSITEYLGSKAYERLEQYLENEDSEDEKIELAGPSWNGEHYSSPDLQSGDNDVGSDCSFGEFPLVPLSLSDRFFCKSVDQLCAFYINVAGNTIYYKDSVRVLTPEEFQRLRTLLGKTKFLSARMVPLSEEQLFTLTFGSPLSGINRDLSLIDLRLLVLEDLFAPTNTQVTLAWVDSCKTATYHFGSALTRTWVASWASLFHGASDLLSAGVESVVGALVFAAGGWIPASLVCGSALLSHCYSRYFGKRNLSLSDSARHAWKNFYDAVGWDFSGSWAEKKFFGSNTLAVLGCAGLAIFSVQRFFRVKAPALQANATIAQIETKFGCGASLMRRNSAKILDQYGLWDKKPIASQCTGSPGELVTRVMRNVRSMEVPFKNEFLKGYITGICQDWAMTSSHYFLGDGPFPATFWRASNGDRKSEKITVTLSRAELHYVGDDIVLFRIPSMVFTDIRDHLARGAFGKSGDCTVGFSSTTAVVRDVPIYPVLKTGKSICIRDYLLYKKTDFGAGSCGLPVIYQKDKGSSVCALHCAGDDTTGLGYGCLFNTSEVLKLISAPQPILQAFSETGTSTFVSDVIDVNTELTQPHSKSPFCYNEFPNIRFLGALSDRAVLMNHSSMLVATEFVKNEKFEDVMFRVFDQYQSVQFGRPMMRPKQVNGEYINPYSLNLKKADKEKLFLDTSVLSKVIEYISTHLVTELSKRGITSLNPLTANFAMNGSIDDGYLRRVNASTAGGFGFPGSKSKYLELQDDDYTRVMSPSVEELVAEIALCLERGEQVGFVYSASLKDEPREISKCHSGKTRVFFISPLPLLVLQRMFLAPFYTLMVQHADVFCTALGVAMHTEGHLLWNDMINFSDLWMEGDYGGYDMQMPFQIGQAAATIVRNVLESCGYSDEALLVVTGILNEGLHPFIHMNGDLYSVPALQPSGKYATAEDNSLRGLVMLLYCWYARAETQNLDFFTYVKPLLYGDDMLAAVKPEVAEVFNNVVYSDFVRDVFGMEFTTAQKCAVSSRFVAPSAASFLKRMWRFHPDLNRMVAALDVNSIYKMMSWQIPSKYETISDQTLAMAVSALWETALHVDERHFNILRNWMIEVLVAKWPILAEIVTDKLPSYSELVSRLQVESGSRPRDLLDEWNTELKSLEIDPLEFEGFSAYHVRSTFAYANDAAYSKRADRHFAKVSRREELLHAIQCLESQKRRKDKASIRFEAEVVPMKGAISSQVDEDKENLTDVMGMEKDVSFIKSAYDFANPTSLQPNVFFERPVKISTITVALSTEYDFVLNPWNLLSLDPSIRAKFRNYSLFRGSIELTVELAASPYHFGRLLIAYIPKVTSNEIADSYALISARPARLRYLSQTYGARVLDVRENKPVTFTLPYINYQPFCRLYVPGSATSLGSATEIPDLRHMGRFYISTLNVLRAANSTAPTSATLYVYARFVDMTLAASTASQTTIVTESGSEMRTGPVERLSSVMASVSGALARVPVFTPWASASEMVFKGIGKFAALLGWSVPRIDNTIDVPHLVVNQPYQNNAVTIGRSTAQKFAFDPLQEVNVDPRIVGAVEDELSLEFMSSILSYLTQFTWSVTDVPMTNILWSTAVIPNRNYLEAVHGIIQPTALSYVSQAFDFWTGEIEYTFDFVISALHRGKVLIQIDPNVGQFAIITATPSLNKQYSLVLDLQDTQRVTVCVAWMQPRQWLRVPREVDTVFTDVSTFTGYANGFLTVFPFTELQSPDGSPIDVNVFVRGKNMKYNQFDNVDLPTQRILTEAGVTFPEEVSCKMLGESVLNSRCSTKFCFGEQPLSFRSYLKRYFGDVRDESSGLVNTGYSIAPAIYPEIVPSFVGSITGRTNVFSYLRYAFLGMSGSVRKRLSVPGARFGETDYLRVTLNEPQVASTSSVSVSPDLAPVTADLKGTVAFLPSTQGGCEVEFPLYTNNFFLPSGIVDTVRQKIVEDSNFDPYYSDAYTWSAWPSYVEVGRTYYFMEETAAAEDFTFFRWIAAPWYSRPVV